MRCSLSLLSIVFHCTVQLNVLANRQCVSPGALWCWIGFCGSVRSTDTTDATSLLDVQVILSRWLWLWSDVVFPCQSDTDINESRSNGELVTPAAIKIGWRPFCVWFQCDAWVHSPLASLVQRCYRLTLLGIPCPCHWTFMVFPLDIVGYKPPLSTFAPRVDGCNTPAPGEDAVFTARWWCWCSERDYVGKECFR